MIHYTSTLPKHTTESMGFFKRFVSCVGVVKRRERTIPVVPLAFAWEAPTREEIDRVMEEEMANVMREKKQKKERDEEYMMLKERIDNLRYYK